MKHTWLITMIVLISFGLYGQELPRITPPSPEATAIAKFGEIPVSHFTGVPNINIPIYTIKQDGISIPIGLSYHARGMKVEEIAPRTGMGWTLTYGGNISRQTRGKPDESTLVGFNEIRTQIDAALQYNASDPDSGENGRNTLFNRYLDGYDFYPDKYMFNANGQTGSFILKYQDLQPLLQNYDDIDITYTRVSGRIVSFVLTNDKGYKYYYGASKDGTRTAVNKDNPQKDIVYRQIPNTGAELLLPAVEAPFINAWQLMEIETPNNTFIKFFYEKEHALYYRRNYDRYVSPLVPGVYQGYISGNSLVSSALSTAPLTSILESYVSEVESEQYQLSRIEFDAGKVEFVNGTALRQDVGSYGGSSFIPYPLEKIKILDQDDTLVKQYKLNYEYKQSASDGNEHFHWIQLDATALKRLFLTSVEEQDAQGNSLPPHTFEYNSQQIPNRFSNSQDAWGYYNGKPNGNYLTFLSYGNNTNDRTVDTVKAGVGMLEKIIYPTGGSTSFTFEHNKVITPIEMQEIVYSATNPVIPRDEVLSPLDYLMHYNTSTNTYEKPIQIGSIFINGVSGITANVNIQVPNGYCGQNNPNQSACNFSITLEGNYATHQLYNGSNFLYASQIPPGNYTLKVKPQNHVHNYTNPDHGFIVSLSWKEQIAVQETVTYAGGKRIKRIEHRDANNALLRFSEFEYELHAPLSGVSGRLYGLPNFKSVHGVDVNGVVSLSPTGASPGMPLSSMQGNSVGYENVTEYYGDKNNNSGKIEYAYTTTPDTGDYYKYPYTLPVDNSWLRGKPLYTKYYKKSGSFYSPVKEVHNEYLYADDINANGKSTSDIFHNTATYLRPLNLNVLQSSVYMQNKRRYHMPLMVMKTSVAVPPDFKYKVYHLSGGTLDLLKTTEKEHGGFLENIEKVVTYDYDYDKHYQLKTTETTDSKNQTYKTTFYYPTDLAQLSGLSSAEVNAANDLLAKNRFEILQTDVEKNTVKQSSVRNLFKIENGLTLPKTVQTAKGTQALEDRVTYHKYDDKGNPIELSKEGGASIYYIWGYNKTLPIAKIENFTSSDASIIAQLIADAQLASGQDDDRTHGSSGNEGNLRTKLELIRNHSALANSQITYYTYDPQIGVTSITDTRGQTVYYDYDDFNRLEFVKDKDNKILSNSQYHYKLEN